MTLSSPSSGTTLQLGGVKPHKSSAPVGEALGVEVGPTLGVPVGDPVGDKEGASDGHSPQTPY